MGRKNLIPTCLDCKTKLTSKNWHSDSKKDGWRLCIKCYNKRSNEHTKRYCKKKRAEDKDFDRARHLKADYGITLDDYDKMFQQQNGVCEICGKKETRKNQFGIKRLAVDHNHLTKKVRGFLCSKHNLGISYFNVDEQGIELLLKAIEYIRKTDDSI